MTLLSKLSSNKCMWESGLQAPFEAKCLSTSAERDSLPPFSFDVFLYLQPAHVALQAGPGWKMFVLLNHQTHRVDGIAHFFCQDKRAYTPWRAPFGGVQVNPGLSEETQTEFLRYLHLELQEPGVQQVTWSQCPDAYAPEANHLTRSFLHTTGYQLQSDQRNHHIPVTATSFTQQAHASMRRRVDKCLNAGFTFQQEAIAALPEAYAFLKQCREEKQKPLSLPEEKLTQYFTLFPNRYFLFTVRKEQELAAVGVAVLVSDRILNHLYPASPIRFNAYSPTVLLNAGLYAFCQEQHITVLDLGVSAPAQEQEADYSGLFTFKERLGGVESWKPGFSFAKG